MKIEKVIISGELPESCRYCDFNVYDHEKNSEVDYENLRGDCIVPYKKCLFSDRDIMKNLLLEDWELNRPDWCPLDIEHMIFLDLPDSDEVEKILKELQEKYNKK